MAEFCGRCNADDGHSPREAALNGMRWPLRGTSEVMVDICEGCGTHFFDGVGWPVCHEETESWYVNPNQSFQPPCQACEQWLEREREPEDEGMVVDL